MNPPAKAANGGETLAETLTLAGDEQIVRATQALAAVCDWASTEDGQGFNGTDTGLGHWLAVQPAAEWTAEMFAAAYDLLRKYRGQLSGFGIDYDALERPATVTTNAKRAREAAQETRVARNRAAREGKQRAAEIAARLVDVDPYDSTGLKLSTAVYNADIVSRVKAVPGRRWNGSANLLPCTPEAVAFLLPIIEEFSFTVTPAAQALIDAVAAAPLEDNPADGVLDYDGKGFVVTFRQGIDRARFDTLLRGVKAIPGRRWDGARKANAIPATAEAALPLARYAADCDLRVTDAAVARLEGLASEGRKVVQQASVLENLSNALDAEFEVDGLGGTLRPFQKAGVAYAVKTKRCFIADDMGTGKTIQALAAIQATGSYPAVVVMPAAVKRKWAREARIWLPGKRAVILSGKTPQPDKVRGADIILINWDILAAWAGMKGIKRGKNACPDAPGLLAQIGVKAAIFDESHYAKDSKAQRSRAAQILAESIPADGLVLNLTGSPLLNRPIELAPQLDLIGRLDDFGGFFQFAKRYCGAYKDPTTGYWDFTGASNGSELHTRLRQRCYVRRLKKDVLPELPPKTWSQVPIALEGKARRDYERAEKDLIAWLRANVENDADFKAEIADLPPEEQKRAIEARKGQAENKARQAEELVRLNTLRQLVARGKIAGAIEWVKDFLESSDEKLVVFAYHKDIQQALLDAFPDALTVFAGEHGKGADVAFQTDPAKRLIICSLTAAREGIDLYAASNAAFIEYGWTPGGMAQAEDRIHRMGQTSDRANYWFFHCDDPAENIDDFMYEGLEAKRAVVEQVADGESQDRKLTKSIAGEVIDKLMKKGAR